MVSIRSLTRPFSPMSAAGSPVPVAEWAGMTAVMWFRRDLRLADNPALLEAAADGDVLPLFVLDPALWGPAGLPRQLYLGDALRALDASLRDRAGGSGGLQVVRGDPARRVVLAARAVGATRVHVAADHGPYGSTRDRAVEAGADRARRRAGPHRVAVRRRAGPGDQGRRDAVRRVHSVPARPGPRTAGGRRSTRRGRSTYLTVDDTTDIPGPAAAGRAVPAGRRRGRGPAPVAKPSSPTGSPTTQDDRDKPGVPGTSQMSVHLKWGEIHPRTLLADLAPSTATGGREVPHRARLAGVLRRRAAPPARDGARLPAPRVRADGVRRARRPARPVERGRTGFPIVDAGMRELRATGWMHNRVRMIVASFLVKDLHVEWQHGARHFMHWLVDGDLASNQHGWQWTAGCGTDAVAVLPGLQPDHAGPQVRPRRPLRPPLGAGARRRRRPARAGRPDRRPRRGAARGARPVGEDQVVTDLLVPRRFCGPALVRQRRLGRGRVDRACSTTTCRATTRPQPGRRCGSRCAARRRSTCRCRWPTGSRSTTPAPSSRRPRSCPGRPGAGRPGHGGRGRRGDGVVPRPDLAPLPDLLRVRDGTRGGRRAADLPGPGADDAERPGPGRRAVDAAPERRPRTSTSYVDDQPARLARDDVGRARLRRRLGGRPEERPMVLGRMTAQVRHAAGDRRARTSCRRRPRHRGPQDLHRLDALRRRRPGGGGGRARLVRDRPGRLRLSLDQRDLTPGPGGHQTSLHGFERSKDGPWWKDAVTYQVYVRSFADSDGDGVGDLPGITARLPYLRDLGRRRALDHALLPQPAARPRLRRRRLLRRRPALRRPRRRRRAAGHRPRARPPVDRRPGAQPHLRRPRLVPGSTRRRPGQPRAGPLPLPRGRGDDGAPPNNWGSVFGGPAWTRADDGQWYLHLFDTTQPDLDWRNPEVPAMFEDVLRFWLDRGVDGFRVDVAHGLVKEESLRDQVVVARRRPHRLDGRAPAPRRADVGPARGARRLPRLAPDPGRATTATGWRSRRRGRRPRSRWRASSAPTSSRRRSTSAGCWPTGRRPRSPTSSPARSPPWRRSALPPPGSSATTTWCGTPTRYGGGERGLARARAATLTMLALPGSAYLYQGEELGLEEVEVAPEDWQDPAVAAHRRAGPRRLPGPAPVVRHRAPYGFGPGDGQPWIPQPDGLGATSASRRRRAVPGSTLEFYRAALRARRTHALGAGDDVPHRRRSARGVLTSSAARSPWSSTAATPRSRCPRARC